MNRPVAAKGEGGGKNRELVFWSVKELAGLPELHGRGVSHVSASSVLYRMGFVNRLCWPIKRKSPARTLVGVNPRTCINGGLTKHMMPAACKK